MKQVKHKLSTVMILGVIALLLIFGLIADFIGYRLFTSTITDFYKDLAHSIAAEAATMVDVHDLDGYLSSEGTSEAYLKARDGFDDLCNSMDAEFIYVVFPDAVEYKSVNYILEAVNQNSPFGAFPVGTVMQIDSGENLEYQNALRRIYEENLDEVFIVQNKGQIQTGHHIAAVVSIRDDDGSIKAILGVQKQMEYLASARINYVVAIVLTTLLLIVLAGAGFFTFLQYRLLRPVRRISAEMERFSTENTLPETSLSQIVTTHDELGALALTLDETERKTLDYFTLMNRITAEQQRTHAEMDLATNIQANMLPRSFPAFPDHDEVDLYATMDPAREVGGDFYDFFMVDDSHLAIVIADVSGKGVPASLFMVVAKLLIKNHAQLGMEPGDVFSKVNHLLCENNDVGLFVTAWIGCLDINTGKLVYANAGHNPPLLKLSDGGFEYLHARPGFVLAGMDGVRYRQAELTMNPGDRLFLYTDGVTEATSTAQELYGEERLKTYLNAHISDAPTDLLPGLRSDMDNFTIGAEQFDDITMLVLDYLKRGEA